MKSFEYSSDFIISTLKLNLLQSDKEPEEFDENRPVLVILDQWSKGVPELKHGLLLWSLQQAIKVEPNDHINQSLHEIAEVLSKRKRLTEDEYHSYRKWVQKQLKELQEELEDGLPNPEERDKKEYRKSNN